MEQTLFFLNIQYPSEEHILINEGLKALALLGQRLQLISPFNASSYGQPLTVPRMQRYAFVNYLCQQPNGVSPDISERRSH